MDGWMDGWMDGSLDGWIVWMGVPGWVVWWVGSSRNLMIILIVDICTGSDAQDNQRRNRAVQHIMSHTFMTLVESNRAANK